MTPAPFGLYLHVPFCRQRCDFCAFYLEVYREHRAMTYVAALLQEIALSARTHNVSARPLESVYIGGGTPTVLTATQLIAILSAVYTHFNVTPHCEITVEGHPATCSEQMLDDLRKAGVTRMSFGAQSMEDSDLVSIGRPGTVQETLTVVAKARAAGFHNINLDLMYGLPAQTLENWQRTLASCLALAPTHLACYALTVEEDTRLATKIERQHTLPPNDVIQIAMDEVAHQQLAAAGYTRYEVSNYAQPDYACRHNLLYWTNGEYLGLGPSAQSYLAGIRFGIVADLTTYTAMLATHRLPITDRITLTEEEQLRDAVIFGLRLIQGIPSHNLHRHAQNYGHEALTTQLLIDGLIEEEGPRSRLSARGRLHTDTIAAQLF